MAKKETNPLIHCEACGESYSATYRRCPFCGSKGSREQSAAQNDDYAFEGGYAFDEEASRAKGPGREQAAEGNRTMVSRGGKRLAGSGTTATRSSGTAGSRSAGSAAGSRSAGTSRGTSGAGATRSGSRASGTVPQGRSAVPRSRAPQPRRSAFFEFWDRVGISPVRVIGFIFTLIVIIVAFLIVTKLVLPAIGRGSVDTPDNEKEPPSQSQSAAPSPSGSSTTKPEDKEPEPTNTIPADQTAVDFTLSHPDGFTISARWPNPVKFEVTLLPAGSKGTVTFTSSDPDVIGVTEDGTVWAVGKGSATITATLPGAEPQTRKVISSIAGGIPPADVTPNPNPAPSTSASAAPSGNLKLSTTEFTMSDKYPHPVTIKVTGASGTVTWTSSNSAVASVDQTGKVSMVGDGKCTITATDSAGNSATCVVRCS